MLLIAGHMGVSMQQKIRSADKAGRDVNEKEGLSSAFEAEARGEIQSVVVVSKDGNDRRPCGPHGGEGLVITKIAQMPNLIRVGDAHTHRVWKPSMGVGDDSDSHCLSFLAGADKVIYATVGVDTHGITENESLQIEILSMWQTAHPHVRDLIAYEPGKPVEELAREMGIAPDRIIKLASNENPLGPSPRAVEAMRAALDRAHFYPDGGGWALRGAIAGKLGVERENVVLGNGSNELIEFAGHAFLKPGDEIVTARHAFAVYPLMAQLFGATAVEVEDPGFTHDLPAMLAAITPRTRQVFIANPNNPTGTMVGQDAIDHFMDHVPGHVLVVFDEAYHEFLDDPPDVLRYVREGRNVLVMRTFSKIQGLANLRIGYGVAPREIAGLLQKTRQPFNANGIAQAGAVAGLQDVEHMRRTRELTHEGRDFFESTFREAGLTYVPSSANFVLVNVGDGDEVFSALLREGIIVRSMRSYKLPEWIRVSVGTMDQNRRFVETLRGILASRVVA